ATPETSQDDARAGEAPQDAEEQRRGSGRDESGPVERESCGEQRHTRGPEDEDGGLPRPRGNGMERRGRLHPATIGEAPEPAEERHDALLDTDDDLGQEAQE